MQAGNRFVINNAPTSVANTSVGQIIRSIDNTSLANTLRGLEVVSDAGSNTNGINTGIRTSGATFGLQAFTSGLGGGVSAPAAIYGESTGTTDGDIMRLYSSTMTTAPYMAQIYHEISSFSGTALFMDLGAGGGSFTGNFVDFQKNDVTKFLIDNAGKVGIGTSTLATTALTVAGDIRVGDSGTNGCVQGFGGATLTGTCTSDQNLKTNVVDITNVIDKLKDLRIVNFNWNNTAFTVYGNNTTAKQTGYIAQNVESVFPELVHVNKDGFKEVNYSALGLYAVEGVKELAIQEASTTALLSRFSSAFDITRAPTTTPSMTLDENGYLGLGTTHPLKLLHVSSAATGTIARFENSSGYCDIDPTTKSLICTTDDESRTNITIIDATSTSATTTPITATAASTTLEKLTQLNVVTYALGSNTSTSTGLILSDIQALFPELVTVDEEGKTRFSLTELIPFIVESVKGLAVKVDMLTKEIAAFKQKVTTDEVAATTICLGDTCVNEAQLKALLGQNQAQGSAPSGQVLGSSTTTDATTTPETASTTPEITTGSASSTPDTTAPVITLNGNPSETTTLNATYTDLGATALDDIDGTITVVTTGTVDTATVGAYTLTYTATDVAGNVSTVTREVVVVE